MIGWTAIYRKIWKNPIFAGRADRVGAFVWMIHTAAHGPRSYNANGSVIQLERGDLCASRKEISNATGLSEKEVRNLLECLSRASAIRLTRAKDRAKGKTIITLCNYDEYQPEKVTRGQAGAKQGAKQGPTNKQLNNSDPKGSGAKAPVADPVKVLFDSGISILTASGISERQARGVIGKWRKEIGDADLITALGKCQREGAIDPVSFVQGIIRRDAKDPTRKPAPDGFKWVNGELIRAHGPKPKGATHENRKPDTVRAACDAETGAVCGQSPDALPTVQPHEEEEERWVSFSDDRAGRTGSDALSPLSMGVH